MERELHCPVCQEFFVEPIRLQCTHHICTTHLSSLANGRTLSCPSCSNITVLPAEGTPPVDKALQLVVDAWRDKMKVPQQNGDASPVGEAPICGFCEEKEATRRCLQCDGILCEDCEKSLHSKGIFKSHTVVDLADSASRGSAGADDVGRRMRCDQHSGEKLNFYCVTCTKQVCSHCLILGEHKNHENTPIDQAYETGKEALTAHRGQIESRMAVVEELLDKLHDAELEVQNNAESQRNVINSELDHLRELVEAKRNQLLSKAQLEEKQKRTQLHAQFDRAEAIRRDSEELARRSSEVLSVSSEHAFLAVVMPLIQDMKKSAGQQIDSGAQVSCMFRPLSTDAQLRCIGDLDLGHPRPPAASSAQASSVAGNFIQSQHPNYSVLQQSYSPAHAVATAAQVSFVPQMSQQPHLQQPHLPQQMQQHSVMLPGVGVPTSVVYHNVRA
mmetsp:Transcript_53266/g.150858  ORF Transcript_53266/g.150858 Transcript_53266/m.150858 type:complete len:444 (+) Transcript_53266:75-1406(+)